MDVIDGHKLDLQVGISEYLVGFYSCLFVLPYLLDCFHLNEPISNEPLLSVAKGLFTVIHAYYQDNFIIWPS